MRGGGFCFSASLAYMRLPVTGQIWGGSRSMALVSQEMFFLWCFAAIGKLISTGQAASTVSFKPMALVTATNVDRRGLPRADNAR